MVVWEKFLAWAEDCHVFVAHNAEFEVHFIRELYSSNMAIPKLSFIDTLHVSRNRFPDRENHQLNALVPTLENRHRALPDAKACAVLYGRCAATYKSGKVPRSSYVREIASYGSYVSRTSPTPRQLSYIEALGGDPRKVSSRADASKYIDELKGRGSSTEYSVDTSSLTESNSRTILVIVALVILAITWLVLSS